MSEYKIKIENAVKSHQGRLVLKSFDFCLFPETINLICATSVSEIDRIEETLSGAEAFDSADFDNGEVRLSKEKACKWLRNHAFSLCKEECLINSLSITDNFIVCSDRRQPFWVKEKKNRALVDGLLKKIDINVNPDQPAVSLSPVQRYQIKLLKCFFQKRYIVVINMLKLRLSELEMTEFLRTMVLLRQSGMCFIVIGFLAEAFRQEIDYIAVVNKGYTIFQGNMEQASARDKLYEFMRSLKTHSFASEAIKSERFETDKTALLMSNICTERLNGISMELSEGHIAVVHIDDQSTGLEFLRFLKGELPADAGILKVKGKFANISSADVSKRVYDGVRCISAPNDSDFFFGNLSAWENYSLQKGMKEADIWFKNSIISSLKRRLNEYMNNELADKTSVELSVEEMLKIRFFSQVLVNPAVLVCVDPFSYINPDMRDELEMIFNMLTERGVAMIIISRFRNTYDLERTLHYQLDNAGKLIKRA